MNLKKIIFPLPHLVLKKNNDIRTVSGCISLIYGLIIIVIGLGQQEALDT